MKISNALVYRITLNPSSHTSQAFEESLQRQTFIECSPTQQLSAGWVPPRGEANGPLLESIGGQWIAQFMTETRSVPASAMKREVELRAAKIEEMEGRKPGKKVLHELKEEALLELLPKAFPRQSVVNVWIDPRSGFLVLDTSSASRGDAVVTALANALSGVVISPIQTQSTPAGAMAAWLTSQEPPQGFSVDRECVLRSTDESKALVRYGNHALDIEEVRQHVEAGKLPIRLALTWNGRVSFQLTDQFVLRSIAFLDVVFEEGSKDSRDDAFDADVAISTGELKSLLGGLINALGGEVQPQDAQLQQSTTTEAQVSFLID
ncbi:MAG: recombination-associated protein RdgC [Burkholderiaceae bacterium]|nr:MAG: recombination-associated protein RdgC [Burkholderiaceae bacterium]TBR76767.1 MAG: recombination-associated protein RdgC [Burkholderiaceae bacterium]